MKNMSRFLCMLLLLCSGTIMAFPLTKESAIDDIKNYMSNNGEDILKVCESYDSKTGKATWSNFSQKGYNGGEVYVLSHGIGDRHNTEWINTAVAAIKKDHPNATILSVNWDKYSNLTLFNHIPDKAPNPTASTWINAVSQLVSDELADRGVTKVEAAIGHSYGAHILAGVVKIGDSRTTNKIKFDKLVAADPAEESLTWTGDQNGNPTFMYSSDKKSRDWGIKGLTTVEVYKSSRELGNDIPLGDYNYIIAREGTFRPGATLMEWSFTAIQGENANHATGINAVVGYMKSTGEIGGWFNNEVYPPKSGSWDALVKLEKINSQNEYKLDLEYKLIGNYSSWKEAIQEYAKNAKNWAGTILDSNYQATYQKKNGTGTGAASPVSTEDGQTIIQPENTKINTSNTTTQNSEDKTSVENTEISDEDKAKINKIYADAAKAIEALDAAFQQAIADAPEAQKPIFEAIRKEQAQKIAEEAQRQASEILGNAKTKTQNNSTDSSINENSAKEENKTIDNKNKEEVENADISDEDKAKINNVYTDAAKAIESLYAAGEQAMLNAPDEMKPYISAMMHEQAQAMAEEAQRQASALLEEAKAKKEGNAQNTTNGTVTNTNGTNSTTTNGTTANGTSTTNANGTSTTNANGTTTVATVVDATYNTVKDSLNTESFAEWCDKTVTSAINSGKDKLVTAATTAVDGALDKLNVGYGTDIAVDIVKKGANELISNSGETIASAVQNIYNDLRKDFSVDSAIESIKNNVKTATSELWTKGKETVTSTFKNLFSWNTLESVIGKGIDALLEKNPTLKTICSALGLTDGKSIVNLGKELFTAVKGLLNGKSLVEVLKNSPALQNLIKNGIKSGINYLVNKFLTPFVNKAITKVSGWLNKLLGNTLGISISETEISSMLTSVYNEGIKLAEKDISDWIDSKAATILGTNSSSSTSKPGSEVEKGNDTEKEKKKNEAPKPAEEVK